MAILAVVISAEVVVTLMTTSDVAVDVVIAILMMIDVDVAADAVVVVILMTTLVVAEVVGVVVEDTNHLSSRHLFVNSFIYNDIFNYLIVSNSDMLNQIALYTPC